MVENWQNDLLCYRAQYSTRVRIVRYEGDRCVAWWGSWRRSRTLQTWRSEMFVRGLDEGKLWIVKHLSTRHQHGLTFETTACFYLYYSYSMLCYPLHSHVDPGCMRMSPILAASSMKWMIFALHCLISETFFIKRPFFSSVAVIFAWPPLPYSGMIVCWTLRPETEQTA
jgi:hypothetical protein